MSYNQYYSVDSGGMIELEVNISNFSNGSDKEIVKRNTQKLLTSAITSLELTSDIISPLLTGKIVYQDDNMSKMLDTHGNIDLYCSVGIEVDRVANEEGSKNKKIHEPMKFSHFFYIESVNILDRTKTTTTYEIIIVSSNIWEFNNNYHISTFNEEGGKAVSNLILELFPKNKSNIKIVVDQSKGTAQGITTIVNAISTKVEYISTANDTVLTSLMSILSKAMDKSDSDLFFLPFDHIHNEYNIWSKAEYDSIYSKDIKSDLAEFRNAVRISVEGVSDFDVMKNEVETIKAVNYKMNSEISNALKKTVVHSFDYEKNIFNINSITSENISSHFSHHPTHKLYKNRLKNELIPLQGDGDNMVLETSDWNSCDSFYTRLANCLTQNGNIDINISGWLPRRPGIDMFIIVDSGPKDSSPLLTLQGRWLVTKIKHKFTPKGYRNNMLLSRLEIPENSKDFKGEL